MEGMGKLVAQQSRKLPYRKDIGVRIPSLPPIFDGRFWQMNRPTLSKADLGEATRQMICARLMLAGVKVFRPMTEDTPIDLLVLLPSGKVLKCQCKYIYPRRVGSHCMNLYSIRKSGPNRKAVRHRYSSDEVDLFLGYCADNDGVYIIPFSVVGGRSELVFWITRSPDQKQQGRVFDSTGYLNAFHFLK